jgi:hypothetical protein
MSTCFCQNQTTSHVQFCCSDAADAD